MKITTWLRPKFMLGSWNMKKLLAIVVLGLFMIGNTYAGTLPPDVQKSLIKNGSIKKGMSFDQVNVATSTGVFNPATVVPIEPVKEPALVTSTFASASKSNVPIVKSS